jgi:hypothetical protein
MGKIILIKENIKIIAATIYSSLLLSFDILKGNNV